MITKNDTKKIEAYVKSQLNVNTYDALKVLTLKNCIVLKVIVGFDYDTVMFKMYDWNFNIEGEGQMYYKETTDELWVEMTMVDVLGSILASYNNFYRLSLRNDYENGSPMLLPNGETAPTDKPFTQGWYNKVKELCPEIWVD